MSSSDGGFQLIGEAATCVLTDVMHIMRYHNEDLNYPPRVLHVCNNRLSWQGEDYVTPWHGDYRREDDRIILRFNHRYDGPDGKHAKLKTTVLYPHAPRVWKGYDYKARRITVTWLSTERYCPSCKTWH